MRVLTRLAVACLVVAAACSDDKPNDASPSSSSAPPPAATASDVPDAALTFAGVPGLAGALSEPSVTCSFPGTDGLHLAVLGTAPDGTTSYRLGVTSDKVIVHVDRNDNGTFTSRNFEGT